MRRCQSSRGNVLRKLRGAAWCSVTAISDERRNRARRRFTTVTAADGRHRTCRRGAVVLRAVHRFARGDRRMARTDGDQGRKILAGWPDHVDDRSLGRDNRDGHSRRYVFYLDIIRRDGIVALCVLEDEQQRTITGLSEWPRTTRGRDEVLHLLRSSGCPCRAAAGKRERAAASGSDAAVRTTAAVPTISGSASLSAISALRGGSRVQNVRR